MARAPDGVGTVLCAPWHAALSRGGSRPARGRRAPPLHSSPSPAAPGRRAARAGGPMALEKSTWRWDSKHLGLGVDVARWGRGGRPLLLFPTAGGDFEESERFHMLKV